uniref:Uncharacterized protein n=1 Tax=Cucumis melo TaxID=3656 RepID=A0A9I9EKA7_CUCME
MEFANDQLKTIATEVVKQHQNISELNSRERIKLMQIIFCSVDDIKGFMWIPMNLKLEYCNVLLKDNICQYSEKQSRTNPKVRVLLGFSPPRFVLFNFFTLHIGTSLIAQGHTPGGNYLLYACEFL